MEKQNEKKRSFFEEKYREKATKTNKRKREKEKQF